MTDLPKALQTQVLEKFSGHGSAFKACALRGAEALYRILLEGGEEKTKALKDADDVIEAYEEKDSTVDMGNLYFSATEYQSAWSQAMAKVGALKQRVSSLQKINDDFELAYQRDIREKEKLEAENQRLKAVLKLQGKGERGRRSGLDTGTTY